jgi:hypothetical protein
MGTGELQIAELPARRYESYAPGSSGVQCGMVMCGDPLEIPFAGIAYPALVSNQRLAGLEAR